MVTVSLVIQHTDNFMQQHLKHHALVKSDLEYRTNSLHVFIIMEHIRRTPEMDVENDK